MQRIIKMGGDIEGKRNEIRRRKEKDTGEGRRKMKRGKKKD